MKPKAPKKKDIKPSAKSGEVRELSINDRLDLQFKALSDVILNGIIKDLDLSNMKPSEYSENGIPIYRI